MVDEIQIPVDAGSDRQIVPSCVKEYNKVQSEIFCDSNNIDDRSDIIQYVVDHMYKSTIDPHIQKKISDEYDRNFESEYARYMEQGFDEETAFARI